MSAFRQMKWARNSCNGSYSLCDYTIKRLEKALLTFDISEKDKEQVELWHERLKRVRYELEHIDDQMAKHLGDK